MVKHILVAIAGFLSMLYLVFPTLGVFELLPDSIPFLGNLDEATAVTILISSLKYYGLDLTNLFTRDDAVEKKGSA